jgi:hypothetical protein
MWRSLSLPRRTPCQIIANGMTAQNVLASRPHASPVAVVRPACTPMTSGSTAASTAGAKSSVRPRASRVSGT